MSQKKSSRPKKRATRESDASFRSIDRSDVACLYLFRERVLVIGRSDKMKKAIENLKMPPLPRTMSNRAEREALQITRLGKLVKHFRAKIKQIYAALKSAMDLHVGNIKDVNTVSGIWQRDSNTECSVSISKRSYEHPYTA